MALCVMPLAPSLSSVMTNLHARPKRVLLVEEDKMSASILQHKFERAGYVVKVVVPKDAETFLAAYPDSYLIVWPAAPRKTHDGINT
jgi:hypothetical protein